MTCGTKVAPYTGAWIEIKAMDLLSISGKVAPYTGAWIEIKGVTPKWISKDCRTLHGCVD